MAVGEKSVGLLVTTEPANAIDSMFDGSGQSYEAPSGDVTVSHTVYWSFSIRKI